MKRQQLKLFIKNMVKEAVLKEIFDEPSIQNMKAVQKQAVSTLTKLGFAIQNVYETSGGIGVVLLRPAGSGGIPARAADVKPNGSINEPGVDITMFLKLLGKGTGHGVSSAELNKQTPLQTKTVKDFERKGYHVKSTSPVNSGHVKIIMAKPHGKFSSDEIVITPNGSINGKSHDPHFIEEDGARVTNDPSLKRGLETPMGFVNVGEQTGAAGAFATPAAFKKVKEIANLSTVYLNNLGINFSPDEKKVMMYAINQFTTGGHPVANVNTVDQFGRDFVVQCLEKAENFIAKSPKYKNDLKIIQQLIPKISVQPKKVQSEKTLPDGRYDNDMESALQSKKISGMSENGKKSEYERHGPCSCGSGLPAYAKLDAKGKPIARVCKRCDRKQRTKIKALSKTPTPIKLDDDDLTEVAGFGSAAIATIGGLAIYKILRNIIDNYNVARKHDDVRMTDKNINTLLRVAKIHNPKLKDDDIEFIRDEIRRAVANGTITTMADLKRYLDSRAGEKKLEEVNKRGVEYPIIKKIKNACRRFFKNEIESIKIAYKNIPNDIVFEVVLGEPKWERKFIRFHGINKPFEVWDDATEKFIPSDMMVRNFPPVEEVNIQEMTGTGAVAGYSTPFAFSRKKDGSKRALDVTKKLGFKVVKSISEIA
jgi:hypothetical protein